MKIINKRAMLLVGIILIVFTLSISVLIKNNNNNIASYPYTVTIYKDGEIFASYVVTENYSLTVKVPGSDKSPGTNVVSIDADGVCVSEADCKNQLCVKQGYIRTSNLPIVCLPNNLIVKIESKSEAYSNDAVTY